VKKYYSHVLLSIFILYNIIFIEILTIFSNSWRWIFCISSSPDTNRH